jgi:hypothetical protein
MTTPKHARRYVRCRRIRDSGCGKNPAAYRENPLHRQPHDRRRPRHARYSTCTTAGLEGAFSDAGAMHAIKLTALVVIMAGGLVLLARGVGYTNGPPHSQVSCTPAEPPAVELGAAAPLDLKILEKKLKDTKAIGLFTKMTLKNQVDDLMDEFRKYYQGRAKITMADLRRSYDLLMMKVLSLLQDEDQKLAADIVSSREAIWALLADPATFATLEG